MAPSSSNIIPAALCSFFLILSCQFLVTKSDEALIQKLCHATDQPEVCTTCVHRDPGSATADGKGIAVQTVHCAEYDAEILFNFTFNLWQNTPKQDPSYDTLQICTEQFLLAHDSFRGATVAIQAGGLNWRSVALNEINSQVVPFLNRCLDLYKKNPQLPLPDRILAGTQIVSQDISIIVGIVNVLPGLV
ncbi:hypothetical protein Tsubulata_000985 [Turnera subulata]|uniref:Pectinesterase inhibitor domain-containing protein n=1 Tax=Turnera subulata TaxID=218843 RepID=A0A9Q0J6G9_9ROSI|nr:hypothetical protein Tsubulata_000985 [Turnera subulata]